MYQLTILAVWAILGVLSLVGKWLRIRIVLVDYSFFGHVVLEPEIIAKLKSQPRRRKFPKEVVLLSLPVRAPKGTREIVRLRKKSFNWIPTFLVSRIDRFQVLFGREFVKISSLGYHSLNHLTSTRPTLVARQSGLPVTFCGQKLDGKMRLVLLTLREIRTHNLPDLWRDRLVTDFKPAIDSLNAWGATVVNVGRHANHVDLLADSGLFVNYTECSEKSLDIEMNLVSHATFCISSLTGFDALCLAMRTPVLYPDAVRPWYTFFGTELSTITFPRYVDLRTTRPLTLSELFARGWLEFKTTEDFLGAEITVALSTPEELGMYALEMASYCEGTLHISDENRYLQHKWAGMMEELGGTAILSRHGRVLARLSTAFLEAHGTDFIK